jgi:branched-chain amino acid transport system substrate-binding protein
LASLRTMKRVAVVLGTFLVSCTSGTAEPDNCVWIGTLNPLTGDLGTVGFALENAARLAVRDVNEAGTIGGRQLCVATGDTRTNPARAAAVVDALVETNDIVALNGAAASASSLEAAVAAKDHEMGQVSCCSTSPALTDDPLIYRTVPSDALQGVVLAEVAATRGASTVSVIYIDDAYGDLLRQQFRLAYDALAQGSTIVAEVPYQSAQTSYADVIQEAFATVPDLVVLIAFPIGGAEIVKAWDQSLQGRDTQWIGTDGLKDSRFALLAGSALPPFEGTAPRQDGPYVDGFRTRYRAAFGGEEPGIFTSNQYDAVMLIALAMAAAGSMERADIRAQIPLVSRGGTPVNADQLANALDRAANGEDIDYVGVSGNVDLDDNGDVDAGYQLWSIPGSGTEVTEVDLCFECTASSTVAAGATCRRNPCAPAQ